MKSAATNVRLTTPSIPEDSDDIENREKWRASASGTSKPNIAQTEPRRRRPLQSIDQNHAAVTPTYRPYHLEAVIKSAPAFFKSGVPGYIADACERDDHMEKGRKRAAIADSQDSGASKTKRASRHEAWIYSDDEKGGHDLLESLKLENVPEGALKSPLRLFRHLEASGELHNKALKLFANIPGVTTLLLGPTFGQLTDATGLVEAGRYPVDGCTKIFFTGYRSLKILDLTCVPIEDDDVRYLIKLVDLQALGLSGTKVTGKGIKYLTQHAAFVHSLRCLKLCYLSGLDDLGLLEVKGLSSLCELDIFGCCNSKLSLAACSNLLTYRSAENQLTSIRLPARLFESLRNRHMLYESITRKFHAFEPDAYKVGLLHEDEVRQQLRAYRQLFPDVFLNLDIGSLREKLSEILCRRAKEEYLWSICS